MRVVKASDLPVLDWDRFVRFHRCGGFWHTSTWRDYQVAYFRGSHDASFAVLDIEDRIIAAVPLLVCRVGSDVEFSYGGHPLPAGLSRSDPARSLAEDRVRALGRAFGARRIRTEFFGAEGRVVHGGRVDASVRRRIVDLSEMPWSGVRKSYRALINRAKRRYRISLHAHPTPATEADALAAFAKYQALHRRLYDSPRPDATYRLQAAWLLDGKAAVTVAEDGAAVWGASYWFLCKDEAYYGSGAYAVPDVSHALVWEALSLLRGFRVARACLGYVGDARTDKERSIEFFKTGFTGRDEVVYRETAELA